MMTAQPVEAQPATVRGAARPASFHLFEAGVTTHRLSRRLVTTRPGRAYRLFHAVPVAAPPPRGHPVIYMLDGNAAFDTLTREHLALVPDLAIVGVGHDTPLRFDVTSRSLDYTPPRSDRDPSPDSARPERMIGGASEFLDVLCGELREAAESGIAVDPLRRTLWGHSLAGLCVAYALLSRPGAFARHAAASPSIWWGEEWLLGLEERAGKDATPKPDVLIALGDSERRSSPTGPHWEGPAPHTLEMIDRLRSRPGATVSSHVFEGLGHAATLAASLPLALVFAAAPRPDEQES